MQDSLSKGLDELGSPNNPEFTKKFVASMKVSTFDEVIDKYFPQNTNTILDRFSEKFPNQTMNDLMGLMETARQMSVAFPGMIPAINKKKTPLPIDFLPSQPHDQVVFKRSLRSSDELIQQFALEFIFCDWPEHEKKLQIAVIKSRLREKRDLDIFTNLLWNLENEYDFSKMFIEIDSSLKNYDNLELDQFVADFEDIQNILKILKIYQEDEKENGNSTFTESEKTENSSAGEIFFLRKMKLFELVE